MKVREYMRENIETVGPDALLQDVAIRMRDGDFASLPVVDCDRLVGVITDRDIVVRAITGGAASRKLHVRQVMSGSVQYCFELDEIEDVARLMGHHQVRRLPVLNGNKRLVGMVALVDLASALADRALGPLPKH